MTVDVRGFAGTLLGGLLFTSSVDFGGDEEDEEDVDIIEAVEVPGRGAIGIATSTVLL